MQSALGRANIFIECHLVKPVTCRIFLLLKAMLMSLHLKINRHSWIKKSTFISVFSNSLNIGKQSFQNVVC